MLLFTMIAENERIPGISNHQILFPERSRLSLKMLLGLDRSYSRSEQKQANAIRRMRIFLEDMTIGGTALFA